MSLPARKLPGAARRRRKKATIRRFQRRLLAAATGGTPQPWNGDFKGLPVSEALAKLVARMEQDRKDSLWPE